MLMVEFFNHSILLDIGKLIALPLRTALASWGINQLRWKHTDNTSVAHIATAGVEAVFLLFIYEVNMAKRRNPKKEKALRNQAYARKFRKRTATTGRFQRRSQQSSQKSEEDEGAASAAE